MSLSDKKKFLSRARGVQSSRDPNEKVPMHPVDFEAHRAWVTAKRFDELVVKNLSGKIQVSWDSRRVHDSGSGSIDRRYQSWLWGDRRGPHMGSSPYRSIQESAGFSITLFLISSGRKENSKFIQ